MISEIVAGFLKDSGRAVVLGDVRTHGKGTVQTLMELGRKGDTEKFGCVKITTARFYRINGNSTQVRGVKSDIHLPSILDHLDIGEDKLPNALPFTKLDLVNMRRVWNLNGYVKRLREKSMLRTAEDSAFKKHMRKVEMAEKLFNRKQVPLEWNKRKEMMKNDRLVDKEKEDEELIMSVSKRKNKDDVVLKEAYNVLADLVEMKKGEELPQSKSNWMDILLKNL